MKTIFRQLIDYINDQKDGVIKRKELKRHFIGTNMQTIDVYRRKLTVCGYLTETIILGVYKVSSRVLSKNLTTTRMMRDYRKALLEMKKSEDEKRRI